jgi:hypothetical protein
MTAAHSGSLLDVHLRHNGRPRRGHLHADVRLSASSLVDRVKRLPGLHPHVRRPTLSRPALKEPQGMLCDVIREQEAAWERRN